MATTPVGDLYWWRSGRDSCSNRHVGCGNGGIADCIGHGSAAAAAVYVDGINLYYGCLKGSLRKWLDPVALSENLLQPHHRIVAVKYFTAKVSGTPGDPSKPQRQDVYLRALWQFQSVEIHFGHFLSHRVRMPLASPVSGGRQTAAVFKTEEKGSDVKLAAHILNDSWLNLYDCAVVVSNDSDLAEAMRLVKNHHRKSQLA